MRAQISDQLPDIPWLTPFWRADPSDSGAGTKAWLRSVFVHCIDVSQVTFLRAACSKNGTIPGGTLTTGLANCVLGAGVNTIAPSHPLVGCERASFSSVTFVGAPAANDQYEPQTNSEYAIRMIFFTTSSLGFHKKTGQQFAARLSRTRPVRNVSRN